MALGRTAIMAARSELRNVMSQINTAHEMNANFINLYTDDNFQKFVNDTQTGTIINDQLRQLSTYVNKMCSTITNMEAQAQSHLNYQEQLNERTGG